MGSVVIEDPQDDLQNTMQEASYLSLSAMAERTDRQPIPTEGLSFLTLLYAAVGISGANPVNSLEENAALSPTLADFRKNVFAKHGRHMRVVNNAAFSKFADFMKHSYPFIGGTELNELYESVMQAHENNNLEEDIEESVDKCVLTYIGVATGILLSPGYAYKEALATDLAAHAVDLLSRVFDHANDLSIIRCLIAVTIHSLFTTYGGSTWHLLGLTMTRCVASGMHTSRVSDPNSDDEEKRKKCRAFWTLYVLDTHVSTTLDRPFCLNDQDIMVSLPHSETFDCYGELRYTVEHARMLRSMRQQSDTDASIHHINLRHWYETIHPPAPPSQAILPTLGQSQLLVRGLIELIKRPHSKSSVEWGMILHDAESDLTDYLSLLEDYLLKQAGAPCALDAFQVFAAAVMIMQLLNGSVFDMALNEFAASVFAARQRSVSQAINILTMLSVRYPAIRGPRDVLVEYRIISTASNHQLASRTRLHELIARSEVMISTHMQRLILGD